MARLLRGNHGFGNKIPRFGGYHPDVRVRVDDSHRHHLQRMERLFGESSTVGAWTCHILSPAVGCYGKREIRALENGLSMLHRTHKCHLALPAVAPVVR
jgi:hypothetical protein